MSSLHLVDPQLLPALEMFPDLDLDAARLTELRQGMEAMIPPLESHAGQGVALDVAEVPTTADAPAIDIILHRPDGVNGPLPLFLHIHGGGYVMGTARQNIPGNIRTALELGCLVASVEYRLAPEAYGTMAVEDCHRALLWLVDNADGLGIDPMRIAIGGESAGGGLAAALALFNRDKGGPTLCFQMLIYPMIDDRTGSGDDDHPLTGEFVWTAKANQFGWRCFLGTTDAANHGSGHVVPTRASDLTGLPPAFISVGALDLFLEEDLDYARRLTRAGVPVELNIYPGAFHGFELAADADVSIRAEADRRTALKHAFARVDHAG